MRESEKNHLLSLQAPRHRYRTPALQPASEKQGSAAPRRPLARFVNHLEPRGDVSTHLSRLL